MLINIPFDWDQFTIISRSACNEPSAKPNNLISSAYAQIFEENFRRSKSSINKLVKVLNNDFKDYSNIKFKKFSKDDNTLILVNNLNITFAHEIKELTEKNINNFEETINKRINRLKSKKDKKII